MSDDGLLEQLRELHKPVKWQGRTDWDFAECRGCDAQGYEWEYPEWPCRTAMLLYPESMIAYWGAWVADRVWEYKRKEGVEARLRGKIWLPS